MRLVVDSGRAATRAAGAAIAPTSACVKPRSIRSSVESRASLHHLAAGAPAFCAIASRAPVRSAEPSRCRCHKTAAAEVHAAHNAKEAEPSTSSSPPDPEGMGRPATAAREVTAAAAAAAGQVSEAEAAAPRHADESSSSSSSSSSNLPDPDSQPAPSTAGLEAAAATPTGSGDMQPHSPEPAEQTTTNNTIQQASPQQAAHPPQPAGASGDAAAEAPAANGVVKVSYYRWTKPRRLADRPAFLYQMPVPDGQSSNVFSFLGAQDPHKGKFYVHPRDYTRFLSDYYFAFRNGYQLFLAEKYFHYPFRYFAELDFPWDLELQLVQAVSRRVIDILTATVQRFYRCDAPPAHLVSMRTPYKVHLNFPLVITTEPMAHMCRDEVVAQCREELGGSYPLDWERIIDFPHGSFRVLGSCKARHMDVDPAWVVDKAYYPVQWSEERQDWKPYGISHQLLCQTSIFPQTYQLREFEGSALFLDMAYRDMDVYRAKIEERRRRRREQRAAQGLDPGADDDGGGGPKRETRPPPPKRGACAVKLYVQEDESVKLVLRVRKWAQKEGLDAQQQGEAAGRPSTSAQDGDAGGSSPGVSDWRGWRS